MARFVLRNQEKIKSVFGEQKLDALLNALKVYESKYPQWAINDIIQEDQPYPTFHVEGIAVVYVIRLMYDVYHLALKEFV
jgi:hypothetical protein